MRHTKRRFRLSGFVRNYHERMLEDARQLMLGLEQMSAVRKKDTSDCKDVLKKPEDAISAGNVSLF
jgi:hypothetical protein